MDAKVREQLESQYPNEELHVIESAEDGIEIVVLGAPPAVWAKFSGLKGDFADAGKRSQADELLVLGSMVWPDRDKFSEELKTRKLMGFYRSASPLCQQISGARESLKMSKL